MQTIMNYIPAPYRKVKGCHNVYINNSKTIDKKRRLWRCTFDYKKEIPKRTIVPIKLKSVNGLHLFRYMNARYSLDELNTQCLTFLSPSLWNDPFESLFYREGGLMIGSDTFYVRCICFTYDWIDGEEAAWNRSSLEEETVRVEYDFDTMCQALDVQAGIDTKFYFSVIDYSLPKNEILKYKKTTPRSLEEYLNLMSLKRKAFSYENEIRLFMVSKKPFSSDTPRIKYSKNLIQSVCFPPKSSSVLPTLRKEATSKGIVTQQSRLYEL